LDERHLACSAEGVRVPWHDPSASRWCVQGAIYRTAYNLVDDIAQAMRIGTELIRSMSPTGGSSLLIGYLPQVNDRQGHAAVLAAIDKALVVP
jgi:hypothetical protein